MPLRLVLRWFACGAPYPWFGYSTRFKASDDIVGADFFKEFAEKARAAFEGHAQNTGLMTSLDDLASDQFEPASVHPLVREFYEYTSRFDMSVTIRWNPLIRPLGALYQWLIARRMRQLIVPLDTEALEDLDSWLDLIDIDRDGRTDFRCWIRVSRESRMPIYVGAYKTYRSTVDGYDASYVTVAFPLPGGNMTTVLTPLNLDADGMMLTTRNRRSSESGVYLLFPHRRSFTMMPAFALSETFELRPAQDADQPQIDVTHRCRWLGLHAFEMRYIIKRRAQRAQLSIEACERIAQAASRH